jgi:hypothetical protein
MVESAMFCISTVGCRIVIALSRSPAFNKMSENLRMVGLATFVETLLDLSDVSGALVISLSDDILSGGGVTTLL